MDDYDLLYERIQNKDWFLADIEENKKKFPRSYLEDSYKKHIEEVLEYKKYGFKITEIDSTNEYFIKGKI